MIILVDFFLLPRT